MKTISISLSLSMSLVMIAQGEAIPKLPIGMNIHSVNYYSTPIFQDVMKSSGSCLTFNAVGDSPWDTEHYKQIPKDSMGYPLEIPFTVNNVPQQVRCLLSDLYTGEYVVLYDGEGELTVGGTASTIKNGILNLTLNGKGENVWLNILRSEATNNIKWIF